MKKYLIYAGIILAGCACAIGVSNAIKYDKITKSISDISDNIDVTVPDGIVKAAMDRAAHDACTEVAKSAVKKVKTDIGKQVNDIVRDACSNVESEVKENLNRQISLTTLDKIEEMVVDNLTKRFSTIPLKTKHSEAAEIIKSCTDAGMASWEITRILESANLK